MAALLFAPHPPKRFRAEFDPKSYPAGAIETLRRDPSARIFTYDQWGDYLIYRLYPRHKVFVDGRSDFYGDDFEEEVPRRPECELRLGEDPGRLRRRHDFIAPSSPLAGALKESSRWRVVYDDGVALVFRGRAAGRGQTGFRRHSAADQAVIARSRKLRQVINAITETKSKT